MAVACVEDGLAEASTSGRGTGHLALLGVVTPAFLVCRRRPAS